MDAHSFDVPSVDGQDVVVLSENAVGDFSAVTIDHHCFVLGLC